MLIKIGLDPCDHASAAMWQALRCEKLTDGFIIPAPYAACHDRRDRYDRRDRTKTAAGVLLWPDIAAAAEIAGNAIVRADNPIEFRQSAPELPRQPRGMSPESLVPMAFALGISPDKLESIYCYCAKVARKCASLGKIPTTLTVGDLAHDTFVRVITGDLPHDDKMHRRVWNCARREIRLAKQDGMTGDATDQAQFRGNVREFYGDLIANAYAAHQIAAQDNCDDRAAIDHAESVRAALRAACKDLRLTDRDLALAAAVLPIVPGQTVLSIAECASDASAEFQCAITQSDVLASVDRLCRIARIDSGILDARTSAQKRLATMADRGVKCGPRA